MQLSSGERLATYPETQAAPRAAISTARDPANRDDDVAGRALGSYYLMDAIVRDLHLSSLHIATLAMLLDACLRTEPGWTLRPWRHVLIDDGAVMQLALKCCADDMLGGEITARIAELYIELSDAKAATDPLAGIAQRYSSAERSRLAVASKQWKRLGARSIHVLRELTPVIAGRLNERFAQDGATLIAFLSDAVQGRTDRISANGEIKLPVLLQRRGWARAQAKGSCRLILVDGNVDASLVDVSREGVGLVCRHEIPIGQALMIEFEDGRRLKATVARRTGDRFGLRLAASLSGSDPLLRPSQSAFLRA